MRPLVLEAIKAAKVDQCDSLRGFLERKFSHEKLGPFRETENVQFNRIINCLIMIVT